MPRPGGRREGTPGRSYQNRTDLAIARAPQSGLQTAAAGGISAPAAIGTQPQQQAPGAVPPQAMTPDMVPRLDDPTARPDEPISAGLPVGPGGGLNTAGPRPLSPDVVRLQAAYAAFPTPELRRTLIWMYGQGAL